MTHTTPSLSVCTSITWAKDRRVDTSPSSRINTTSPTETFLVHRCHLGTLLRQLRYSVDQHFHTWRTRAWHSWKWHRREIDSKETDGSGKASRGRPVIKWPGVNALFSLLLGGSDSSCLLFRHASIWESTMVSSSKVSFTGPMTQCICFFMLRTAASDHSPPKWGARSGMNCHCISWDAQKSEMSFWVFNSARNSKALWFHARRQHSLFHDRSWWGLAFHDEQ